MRRTSPRRWTALRPGTAFAVVVVLLLVDRPAANGPPAGWFGTWTLNLSKSIYDPGPPPYRRAKYTIQPWDDGLKVVYEMVHPRGGVTRLEWTGRIDGREYQVQGIDAHVTYAYRPIGDGKYEVIVRIDDQITGKSTVRLSADGRSMITTTIGTNSKGERVTTTTVYEREGD